MGNRKRTTVESKKEGVLMENLYTCQRLVKEILTEDPQTRNSDSFLYFKVLKKLGTIRGIDIDKMSITHFLLNMKEYNFPPFESVRRSRQKIQAECPELAGAERVMAMRAEREKEFREFARSGCNG